MDLAKEARFSFPQIPLAAGSGTTNGTGLDMSGHRAITFVGVIEAQDAEATAELQAQESEDNVTYTPIAGASNLAPANQDNKILVLGVLSLRKKWVRPVLVRGGTGNTTWGGTIAIATQGRQSPAGFNVGQHAAAPVSVIAS